MLPLIHLYMPINEERGPLRILGGIRNPKATPSWLPNTPTDVAVASCEAVKQKTNHHNDCDIPKHLMKDPAAFIPDPIRAIFRSPVFSMSHIAGNTSGINVAI